MVRSNSYSSYYSCCNITVLSWQKWVKYAINACCCSTRFRLRLGTNLWETNIKLITNPFGLTCITMLFSQNSVAYFMYCYLSCIRLMSINSYLCVLTRLVKTFGAKSMFVCSKFVKMKLVFECIFSWVIKYCNDIQHLFFWRHFRYN